MIGSVSEKRYWKRIRSHWSPQVERDPSQVFVVVCKGGGLDFLGFPIAFEVLVDRVEFLERSFCLREKGHKN